MRRAERKPCIQSHFQPMRLSKQISLNNHVTRARLREYDVILTCQVDLVFGAVEIRDHPRLVVEEVKRELETAVDRAEKVSDAENSDRPVNRHSRVLKLKRFRHFVKSRNWRFISRLLLCVFTSGQVCVWRSCSQSFTNTALFANNRLPISCRL